MTAVDHTNVDPIALGAALAYAGRGLRVVPILPGKKYPDLGDEWQKKATNDVAQIRSWWERNPGYGVGVRTGWYGDRCVFVLDVDNGTDKDGRIKEGDDSLADLEAEYGDLPATVEAMTPSGGRHLYFWAPVEIRNDQAGRLGVDLDIRGEGGQVLAPPTVRPDGRAYVWAVDQALGDLKIAQAPTWLVDLLTATVEQEPRAERKQYDGPPRPGDRFAASVTWPQLLQRDGATFMGHRTDRKTGHSYELWARPGVDDHTSATLYYGGYDLLKLFTPNWPGLENGKTYSRFGYWVATRYGNDFTKATAELGRQQSDEDIARWIGGAAMVPPPQIDPSTGEVITPEIDDDEPALGRNWKAADLAAVWAGGLQRALPTVLQRDDGAALLYAGKTNTIFGESGAGKTWLLYIAAAQLILAGRHVIIIDFEDDAISYFLRLIALGVPPELVIGYSTYYPVGVGAAEEDLEDIDAIIAERDTAMVGIDSTGEALAAQGLNQDKDNEVAFWMGRLPRRWARLGPCVTMLDHMPHGGGREIGSQRKRAGVSGAAYEAIATEPFSKGKAGTLTLKVAKDRGGNYAKGTEQAVIAFTPSIDGTVMDYAVAVGSGRAITSTPRERSIADYEDAIVAHLEQEGAELSQRALLSGVPGDDKALKLALRTLVSAKRVTMREYGKSLLYSLPDGMEDHEGTR